KNNNGNEDEQQNCNAQTGRAWDCCCSQASSRGQDKTSKAKGKAGGCARSKAAHPSALEVRTGGRSTPCPRSRQCFTHRSKKTQQEGRTSRAKTEARRFTSYFTHNGYSGNPRKASAA